MQLSSQFLRHLLQLPLQLKEIQEFIYVTVNIESLN